MLSLSLRSKKKLTRQISTANGSNLCSGKKLPWASVIITSKIMAMQMGLTTRITRCITSLSLNAEKQMATISVSVKAGVKTPVTATRPPKKPAVWLPAKVAQFTPSDPGVISAMAIRLVKSAAVIQPCLDISSMITGIIDMPPKLVKPIFTKDINSSQ